ncbi:peptide/nickel transport system substrate-binding protein [Haloactinospora alba]|uniref:Peptide/nickel transport system substrate-binding protein n=1 Tax=Haloactinospora alba TaxID=405555 RepID=A0A543N6R5_9ACTN|nr:ABC transporter substrate-binding protein [Haloactinospora alba]TQN27526.1 peptide/nickel transport system substrate-binding protein [Haloactinospora alba]
MTKHRLLIAAGASVGLLATGCTAGSGGGDDGDTLTYALGDEPEQLNPALVSEHLDPVTEMVFTGLTAHDADNEVIPALAEEWEISDDETHYTFTLRDDVTWHDGEPFTAADVVFTVEGIRDGDLSTSNKFANVTDVAATDEHTVELELSEPTPALLDSLSNGMLPEHVLAGSGVDAPDFGANPVGTGPFELETWKHGEYAELSANEDFYGGSPGLDGITVSYVPDAATRLIQVENGDVDAASLAPEQADEFEEGDGLRAEVFPTADYRGVMFNMDGDRFADPAPRKAMNYAVDREAIVDSVLHGYGSPASGPLDRSRFHTDAADYGFDPDRVAEIMTDAGYERNEDGIWAKDGEPVAFDLTTFAEDDLRAAMVEVLATQFTEQGFDVTADPQPRDAVDWDNFDAFLIGWGTPYDPDGSLYGPFHSSEALDEGGSNYGSYADDAVDEALEQGRSTNDPDTRADAYADFQEALADNPPYVFVSYLEAVNVVPDDLGGIEERTLAHHGYGFFYNAQDWSYGSA